MIPVVETKGLLKNFFIQTNTNGGIGATSLEDYKVLGANASPQIVVQFFDDLGISKQTVLGLVYFQNSNLDRTQITKFLKMYFDLYLNGEVWPQNFNEFPEHFDFTAFSDYLQKVSRKGQVS